MSIMQRVMSVYQGSDAVATRALYADLEALGAAGVLAAHLLRASKKSERAKQYTRRFRGASYTGKEWAMGEICRILLAQPDLVRAWGWGIDDKQALHRHVLYVDLYVGQVSFHTGARGQGPDYTGQWDGKRGITAHRVCLQAAALLGQRALFGKVLAS